MASFFDNINKMEKSILGPDYAYYKQIKPPSELGMSSEGSIGALSNDISGLIGYVKTLVIGGGKAQRTDGGLGNRFFLETGAKCKYKNNDVSRSIYIDNIPNGIINFDVGGINMGNINTGMSGLMPGLIGRVFDINPIGLYRGFTAGIDQKCVAVRLPTGNAPANNNYETHFLTEADALTNGQLKQNLKDLNATIINENFENRSTFDGKMPDNILIQLYYSSLGLFGLYILLKLFEKK